MIVRELGSFFVCPRSASSFRSVGLKSKDTKVDKEGKGQKMSVIVKIKDRSFDFASASGL